VTNLTREELLQQTLERYAKRMENLLYELNSQVIASEPKPFAWCIVENGRVHCLVKTKPAVMNAERWQPLYTAPPQRELCQCDDIHNDCTYEKNCRVPQIDAAFKRIEWQGLTDEDREWCDEHSHGNTSGAKQKAYGRAIEAKLKEKNT